MKRAALAIVLFLVFLLPIYATELSVGVEAVFGAGIVKPTIGIDINKIYTGLAVETMGLGLFASLGLGGAVNIRASRNLGSVLLFHVSVGIGHRLNNHRISVVFDHVSNADLASYNPGLNVFGIRYGYRF